MNNLDKQYTDLLQDILDNGVTKQDRTGTGTLSVFGRQIRHKMSEGFPLLTTKKMPFRTIATELLWFLRGDTNIKFLVDNDCHIWNGDAYKNYRSKSKDIDYLYNKLIDDLNKDAMFPIDNPNRMLTQEEFINKIKTDDEFAKKWGELGPIYGRQWRRWKGEYVDKSAEFNVHTAWVPERIDQITNLISDLKTNPDSRRLMVNAWNVGELDQQVLPPCHYGFQVYTRELSLEERQGLYAVFTEDSYDMDGNLTSPLTIDWEKTPKRAISLMWNQRSVDTFLGLPFNIASYGLLLEIIAKAVNMVPDELIGNLGDVHLYSNHIEQAKEQIGRELSESERYRIFEDRGYEFRMVKDWSKEDQYDKAGIPKRTREPFELPKLRIVEDYLGLYALDFDKKIDMMKSSFFILENYQSHPAIKAPLSN